MNKFEIFFPRDCGGFTDLLVHMKGTRRSIIRNFACLRASTSIPKYCGNKIIFTRKCVFVLLEIQRRMKFPGLNQAETETKYLSSFVIITSIKCNNENLIKIGNMYLHLHTLRKIADTYRDNRVLFCSLAFTLFVTRI